jgi:hypothetical protein
VQALHSQDGQLAAVQTRASFLLAASGIATGAVLSGPTGGLHGWGVTAVIAFGMTGVLATLIIAPRRNKWAFTTNAHIVIDAVAARPEMTSVEVLEWLAKKNQDNYARNRARLDSLYSLLSFGCACLVWRWSPPSSSSSRVRLV